MQMNKNDTMTIAKALEIIITEHGKEVLKSSNMVQSMVMDYMGSGFDNEKKLFKVSCQHGILKYAYEILSLKNNGERQLVANKAKNWLEAEAFLSEENAVIAVNIILEAIHSDFQLEIETVKKIKEEKSTSNTDKYSIEKKDVYSADILEDAEKCFKKGNDYYNGCGVEQNYVEAVKWYRKAAEQGHAIAQFNYAACLHCGVGIEQNYVEEVKWLRKAAEQGLVRAQFNYATSLERGRGIKQNMVEAVKWYRKAAEQGYAKAQFNYATCLHDGAGIEQNYVEEVKWLRKAAEQGHTKAQFFYGVSLEKGIGIEQNHIEAIKWYRKAAEQGDQRAKNALKRLNS